MKLLKFIPLQLTIALTLGILTGHFFEVNPTYIAVVSVCSFVFLISIYFIDKRTLEPSLYYPIITLITFYFIGIAAITFHDDLTKKQHYTFYTKSENSAQNIILIIDAQLRPSLFHEKFVASVLQVDNLKSQGKILLNRSKNNIDQSFKIGDKILVRSQLKQVNGPKNPYQFNYKKYLEKQQIFRQVTIEKEEYLILSSKQTSLKKIAETFRKRVNHALQKVGFENDELSIINALLLGQRQEVSKELIENYTKAGAIHILAISGLHVGILLWLLTIMLKPLEYLKNGKTIKLILAIILLWSFAFIAGLSPSVVRAVTMFTAVAISLFGQRKSTIYNNLIISMFFLLLFNPMYLFNVGFQLSYFAVFFIVWLQPIISKLWKPKSKPIHYLWDVFTVSLAAQLGVLPLSLYYFHQFPGLFFITNLVIIPVLSFVLGIGLLVIFLSLLNYLPEFLAEAFQKLILLMNQFIGWVAQQEFFLLQNISFSALSMIASYILIIFSFRWIEQKSYTRFKYALLAMLLLQSVFIYEKWSASSKDELIAFNKSRYSIIGERSGQQLKLCHSLDSLSMHENLVKSYITGGKITKVSFIDSISKSALLKRNILLLDSLGVYQVKSFQPKIILLTQSPKVNLERLIRTIHPKKIIADNSNFKSFVKHWQETSVKYNIPFYYTNEEGAFILEK